MMSVLGDGLRMYPPPLQACHFTGVSYWISDLQERLGVFIEAWGNFKPSVSPVCKRELQEQHGSAQI